MRHGIVWAVILSLFLVSEAWPQAGRRHLMNEDAHHPRSHAATHSQMGADQVVAESLASNCADGAPLEGDGTMGVRCGSYPSSPDAEFVVGAAHGGLTSEWVLGTDVLFRSVDCDAETDKAIGAVCFQSDNAGAWRHGGSNVWTQVAAPVPGAQYVVGAATSALGDSQVLGTDIILVSSDCTTVTGKPVGAVCLNPALTRLWRHAGSDSWSEVAPALSIQSAYTTEITTLENADRMAASDSGETDTPTGYVQVETLRNDLRPTARDEGTDIDADPEFYDFRGTGVTVTQDGEGARVTISSTPGTTTLPWTSITDRPDITVGTNPGDFESQDYAFEVAARDISSGVSPSLRVGRNTNSANQRAGFVELESRDGTDNRLWFDNDGKLCKSDSSDPDGTDSNCEAVGVDPQIITMVVQDPAGSIGFGDTTYYWPIWSGVGSISDPRFLDLGDVNEGTQFPAGRIDSFGFSLSAINNARISSCTMTVTVNDDGTDTTLTGSQTGRGDHSNSNTITVGAGSIMNLSVTSNANCGAVDALSITMNFMPS